MEIYVQGPDSYMFRSGCYMGTNYRTGDALNAGKWCIGRESQGQLDACFSAIGENLPYFETPLTTTELTVALAVKHAKSCELAPISSAKDACVTSLSRVFTSLKVSKTLGKRLWQAIATPSVSACLEGMWQTELYYEQRGLVLP